MARKRRLPFDCFTCGKRFENAQAVRGHRRHCRYPRLSGSLCLSLPLQPGTATRVGKRPGPLSQEAKLLTFDTWEGLEELQRTARHFRTVASSMAAINVEREFERAKEWAEIYRVLDDCRRDFDPMLPSFRLDRGVLFGIYVIIRHLNERWIQ
jgi:hypothetical protein